MGEVEMANQFLVCDAAVPDGEPCGQAAQIIVEDPSSTQRLGSLAENRLATRFIVDCPSCGLRWQAVCAADHPGSRLHA
jgi:hypothetical protein